MLSPIRRNRAEKCNLLQKSGGKIWWFHQKLLPLHSQFRNDALKNAPLAQLVEQLTLNQWV